VAVRSEADAVVRHDTLNPDTMRPIEAHRVEQEAQARAAFLIGQDLGVSDARVPAEPAVRRRAAKPEMGRASFTAEGWFHGAGPLDRFSRRVVGWPMTRA
jgi:hypothetical protein